MITSNDVRRIVASGNKLELGNPDGSTKVMA